jgi:hypothetical protein
VANLVQADRYGGEVVDIEVLLECAFVADTSSRKARRKAQGFVEPLRSFGQ